MAARLIHEIVEFEKKAVRLEPLYVISILFQFIKKNPNIVRKNKKRQIL